MRSALSVVMSQTSISGARVSRGARTSQALSSSCCPREPLAAMGPTPETLTYGSIARVATTPQSSSRRTSTISAGSAGARHGAPSTTARAPRRPASVRRTCWRRRSSGSGERAHEAGGVGAVDELDDGVVPELKRFGQVADDRRSAAVVPADREQELVLRRRDARAAGRLLGEALEDSERVAEARRAPDIHGRRAPSYGSSSRFASLLSFTIVSWHDVFGCHATSPALPPDRSSPRSSGCSAASPRGC